eukprot:4812336-Pyramimonas_sp.AAC.1
MCDFKSLIYVLTVIRTSTSRARDSGLSENGVQVHPLRPPHLPRGLEGAGGHGAQVAVVEGEHVHGPGPILKPRCLLPRGVVEPRCLRRRGRRGAQIGIR